jgi:phospholipid transport system substrate-binding protein
VIEKHTYPKFALAAMLVFFASNATAVESPKAQLQDTMERVMAITATFRSEKDFTDNKPQLKQIILPRFDFSEMARRSLGEHWDGLNGREKEFVAAFVQFAEASYMNALGSYRGEKMIYGREQVNKNFAEVETHVVGSHGEVTPISYMLHLNRGQWKIYDVVIDQISLVSNFHSQFGRILQTASMDELMRRLREKGTPS